MVTAAWMYGLNAGYDTRTVESGDADTNIPVFDKQTIFFNQVAVNAEASPTAGPSTAMA